MFESTLNRGKRSGRRFGIGAIASVTVHAALLAGALVVFRSQGLAGHEDAPTVTFFNVAQAPAAAPAAPGAGALAAAAPKPTPVRTVAVPKSESPRAVHDQTGEIEKGVEAPETPTPATSPLAQPSLGTGTGGSGEGVTADTKGVPGGTGVGPSNGTPAGGANMEVLPFGPGMERPHVIEPQPSIVFTRAAMLAHVEGTALVSCEITVEGVPQKCRLIKSLPFMDDEILKFAQARRYTPALFQGRPTAVRYPIQFPLKAP